jgi:hypothetical protein
MPITGVGGDRAAGGLVVEADVAVAGDPRDHAFQNPAGARVLERPEPQRVHQRDRARPHGEDVAQDPADPGRRPLVGLDEGSARAWHSDDTIPMGTRDKRSAGGGRFAAQSISAGNAKPV